MSEPRKPVPVAACYFLGYKHGGGFVRLWQAVETQKGEILGVHEVPAWLVFTDPTKPKKRKKVKR
jgi:hypothetical protein